MTNKKDCLHRFKWEQWIAAIVAMLPLINVGNEEFWIIKTLKNLERSEVSSREDKDFLRAGFFIAATSSVVGAIIGVILADNFGRKKSLLVTSIFAIGQILSNFSTNSLSCCVALLVGEIGLGITRVLVPLYVSEIVDNDIRGAVLMLQLPFFYCGKLVAVSVSYLDSSEILCFSSIILTATFLITFTWFPETPYYLISQKKYQNASDSLAFYRNMNYATNDNDDDGNKTEITVENFEIKNNTKKCCGKIRELLKPNNRKGLLIIMFLIITKWSEEIIDWQNHLALIVMDTIASNHEQARIIVYVINIVAGILIVLTIDIIGRRSYLLYSTFGGFAIVVITLFFKSNGNSSKWLYFGISIPLHFCQLIIYAVSLVYVGELFSTNVKALAISIVTIVNLLISFIIITLSEVMESDVNSFILGVTLLFAFPLTLAFIPETKEKSFSQIQKKLATLFHCGWLRNTIDQMK